MRVVIITNFGQGLYNFRKELLEKFIELHYHVDILMPKDYYTEKIEKLGCSVSPISIDRRGMNPIKDFHTMIEIYHLTKKLSPDIVLTYTIKPNIYGGIISRILKLKYIVNITGLGSSFQRKGIFNQLIQKLYGLSVKKADWVFIQNNEIQGILKEKKLINENNSVIPGSGVCLQSFPFMKLNHDSTFHFLFLGRLMREKGIYEFLEAAKVIVSKFPNVYFDIVGMKDDDIQMESYLNEYIVYHGKTDDSKKYYEKCTCLIQPSYHEGMSNVVLEACSCGRPCLVSNIPGCKEIVEDGVNGFLFEPHCAEGIVSSIEKIMALDQQELLKMSFAARKCVETKFNRSIVIDAYIQKMKELEEKKYDL